MKTRVVAVLSLVLVLAVILGACAPAQPVQTPEREKEEGLKIAYIRRTLAIPTSSASTTASRRPARSWAVR